MGKLFKPVTFASSLVFGFDVGSTSIGYAVRKGTEFREVGVLVCPQEVGDLKGRRALRRQRRTLRSRQYRRTWLAKELEKLGFPKPRTAIHDPVTLRLRGTKGEAISAEEVHMAITHLFKRRGFADVPWANRSEDGDDGGETGEIREAVQMIRKTMEEKGCALPCELLDQRRKEAGKSPTAKWGRKIYWPRELLEKEFRTLVESQSAKYPELRTAGDWLLYGDCKEVKGARVYFKSTEGRNPGALGLRWPRFENRGPALDVLQPVDEQGRRMHVVRRNKQAFVRAQWELAVINFRVIDRESGLKTRPDATSLARLREIWENSRRKKKKQEGKEGAVKVSKAVLKKWAAEHEGRYRLIEDQQELTPETGAGRARYSSPTLDRLRETLASGGKFDPPQPTLRRGGETTAQALERYLSEVKHPLVHHRLVLFRNLLKRLVNAHGEPDLVVVEAVRSLALSQAKKREVMKRNKENRDERAGVREEIKAAGKRPSGNSILRYRLWKEAGGVCPFCGESISQAALLNGEADLEHLVPRSRVDCNEYYNLTVGHLRCNREVKGDRTPFEAFGHAPEWEALKANAEKCFKGRKLTIFLSDQAEDLVESQADLQHTAYMAKVLRQVTLISLGWLDAEGKDPTPEKQNAALSFQVTNGQITSRLRQAWGLNQILHPLPEGRRWEELSETEQAQMQEKNRGDFRHHALDAMVIACTLPWLAHRTHGAVDAMGNYGWWRQDEKGRSMAANPAGLTREVARRCIEKVVVQHHASRSRHRQGYATTLYRKKEKDVYVAREVFSSLKVKDLDDIWPETLAAYCGAAWERYAKESGDIDEELRKTKGCLPGSFIGKLCFAHFQAWRAQGGGEFDWPKQVKIPIRSVRLISVKDDSSVAMFDAGTQAYVKRKGFREVRLQVSEDGKRIVPVLVPYWRGDKPVHECSVRRGVRPIGVIRVGMVVETKNAFSTGQPSGKYRIVSTGQQQVRLLPHHIANKEEATLSFGLPKKGLQPYWPDFIRAMGYELPHSSSAESGTSDSAEV